MSQIKRTELAEGVFFTAVKDSRFKTMKISANIIAPLSGETASANALLCGVLSRSTAAYPDFTALSKKLSSLYGADLNVSIRKSGDNQVLSISASGLDDRYTLEDESVAKELSLLLCGVLFDPNLSGGAFVSDDVEQERRQLLDVIDSEFNDKRLYANGQMIRYMCENEVFGIKRYGTAERIKEATPRSLYETWKNLLDTAVFEIIYIGDSSPEKAAEVFKDAFKSTKRTPVRVRTEIIRESGEPKRIVEEMNVSQSKLVMGYRCKYPESNRECVANSLMSVILGGAPTSKLFLNVREKQSLCYYCASMADNEKGILLIDSGVETDKIEKTEKAVTEQVELLKSGDLTDDELIHAKLLLKNAYISSLDSLGAMDSYYAARALRESPASPQESAEIAESITRNEILELASCIKLDTVFSLVGN